MKEIKITEIENIRIGSAENKEAGTGCTVIICERGAAAGLDVRGGGPASRESELLKPMAAADVIQQFYSAAEVRSVWTRLGALWSIWKNVGSALMWESRRYRLYASPACLT